MPAPPADVFTDLIGRVPGNNATGTTWLAYVGALCLVIT